MSSPSPRLQGKVALITGAASGIGETAARLFVQHGAALVVVDIQDKLGSQVVDSIDSDRVSYFNCDVREEAQVSAAVNYAVEKYGKLDILYSNAGILSHFANIMDMDLAVLDNTMAINLRGVAATIKHAARAMVDRGIQGSIVCTGSVAAPRDGSGPHDYTESKHALLGLVRVACSELGEHGIRVNCISPFGVATGMTAGYSMAASVVEENVSEMGNMKGVYLKTKDVAEAALYLASDESRYVSGQNLVVDGGVSVVVRTNGRPTEYFLFFFVI